MFSKPGSYECMMRYSSLTPKMLPDTVSAPRGQSLTALPVCLAILEVFGLHFASGAAIKVTPTLLYVAILSN